MTDQPPRDPRMYQLWLNAKPEARMFVSEMRNWPIMSEAQGRIDAPAAHLLGEFSVSDSDDFD